MYSAIHAEISAGYSEICYHCGNDNILKAGSHDYYPICQICVNAKKG